MMSKGYSSKIKLMIAYKITANPQLPTANCFIFAQHPAPSTFFLANCPLLTANFFLNSALSTQHSALSTQHFLSTQHSALRFHSALLFCIPDGYFKPETGKIYYY